MSDHKLFFLSGWVREKGAVKAMLYWWASNECLSLHSTFFCQTWASKSGIQRNYVTWKLTTTV